MQLTFEILPADPKQRLPDEVRQIEGGRSSVEEVSAGGEPYRKALVVLPLPNGDTRERVFFFAEENDRMRMLGFHRIHRHFESPRGETVVFDSGTPNPLTGKKFEVPPDTYTLLGLCWALGSLAGARSPARVNLWLGERGTESVEISAEAREDLPLLGTRISSRRLRVRPLGSSDWTALYWVAEAPPHSFLQYRGPGDFLTESGGPAPPVLLRVTSSSEQVRKVFP